MGFFFVEGILEVWEAFRFASSIRSGGHGLRFPWASMVSTIPVLFVLLWKGEFSFFDCLKDRGPRKLSKIVQMALIPVAIGFIANLIQNPSYLGLLPKHFSAAGIDLFAITAIGMGLLSQLCVTPTLVKTLGDRLNWLWFVGAVALFVLIPNLCGQIFVSTIQNDSGWEKSMIVGMVSRLSVPAVIYAVVFALTCLLMLLWSKGDMRSVIAVTLFGIVQRFLAPPFFSVIGVTGQVVGLIALWIAVGGFRRWQNSRSSVASEPNPEV